MDNAFVVAPKLPAVFLLKGSSLCSILLCCISAPELCFYAQNRAQTPEKGLSRG